MYLNLKGTNVDVNVHPTKMEVRFSDEKGVFTAVKQAVESTLKGQEMIIRSALVKEREAAKKTGRYTNPAPFETGLLRERESAYKATGQSTAAPNTSRSFPGFSGGKNTSEKTIQEEGIGSRQTESARNAEANKNIPHNSTDSKISGIEGNNPENSENKDFSAVNREFYGNPQKEQIAPTVGIIPPASTNVKGAGIDGNNPNVIDDALNSSSNKPAEQTAAGKTAFAGTDAAVSGQISDERGDSDGRQQAEQTFAEKDLSPAVTGRLGADTVFEQQELLPGMLSPKARSRRRILGCAFRTYWIIEYGSELFLIDQHAAHEKVLYERLTKMYRDSAVTQQMISPPLIFTATLEEKALLDEYLEAFAEIGFEIEPFGGREYKVSAVPYHLSMLGTRALFTEMLDHLETTRDPKKLSIYILRIATEACKAAVKGGDQLSLPEAEALIDELFLCEDPYHCPHGRPTIISFTEKELEKRFKRIV